ncbi:Ada metal-binding domain-containing protein [Sphingobacterium faecium]|uniref:Ada metal-binding domain-containing protein n=1 Tax=Sphingobacterium faecium TaxID=34087 RepID=UPI000D34CCC4|nr:Ada metal-binding domain-containing protein [Sphingobacterium faecium]PTX09526.1 metal binding Ada-like protein [Sphingobacterium faecium]
MIQNIELGDTALDRIVAVNGLVKRGMIKFSGDSRSNIYGLINCASGRRTRIKNRVFFKDEKEALDEGYRPCSHCLNEKYRKWKEATLGNLS